MPMMNRYTGKAMLKGKIQKTGNPKIGRKNIKWHMFYTSVSIGTSHSFEDLFKLLCSSMILIIPCWKDGVFILTKNNHLFHAIISGKVA